MVATIKLLTGSAAGASIYFDLLDTGVQSRYYATEFTGIWHGGGAEFLDLKGSVIKANFEAVLAGTDPAGRPLVACRRRTKPKQRAQRKGDSAASTQPEQGKTDRAGKSKPPPKPQPNLGMDVTFSVPKSVSIVWSIGPAWVRRAIEQGLHNASKQTLTDLESLVPLARRGKGGGQAVFAKLVIASFMHTLNRDNEPQLHVHNVIANTCLGADGRWAGVNSQLLHKWTPALGRIFRCHLARELKQALGVELIRPIKDVKRIRRPKNVKQIRPLKAGIVQSWFEIKGISRHLIEKFSSRRRAIEQALTPGELKNSYKRQEAAIKTRPNKTIDPDIGKLRADWQATAARFGIDEAKIESLCSQNPLPQTLPDFDKVFVEAVHTLGRAKSHFHEADVVSAVCEVYQHHGVDPVKLVDRVRKEIGTSPEAVVLRESPANTRLTSRENWELENQLLKDADTLINRPGAVVKESLVAKSLRKHKHLDDEQQQAVTHLARGEGSIRVLSGVAGAGKSTTLDAVRDAFERAGYRVLGTAIAGKIACELTEKTGIESRTVASILHHLEKTTTARVADRVKHDVRMLIRVLRHKKTWKHEPIKIPRKSVLIIDEAGMLDTRTLAQLLHHCKKSDATVILTGDTKQLPPILAGGPLDHLAKKTGQANLTVNRRQQNQQDRDAVEKIRSGDIAAALKDYAERDRLTVATDVSDAKQQLTKAWTQAGGYRKPADHLILTQTRAEAREINDLCQRERLKRARLLPGLSIKHGNARFYIGDRISFHQPMRKQGIENGHAGTVIGVDPITRKITVKLDRQPTKQQQQMGIGRVARISLLGLDGDAVGLGYASTTHRAQGLTCNNAYVLLAGPMMSREFTYTQLTRAKDKTRLFVDEATAGKDLESLVKAVTRSSGKDLAHDHVSDRPKNRKSKGHHAKNDVKNDPPIEIDRSPT